MPIHDLPEGACATAVALWHEAGLTRPWNDPYADLRRALDGPTSTVLAATDDAARLLGTVMVGHDGHRRWMYYLAVTAGHRRRGLGRGLVAAGESWLAERGAPKVNLMVREGNTAAVGFYRALGCDDGGVVVLGRFLPGTGAPDR